MVRKWTPNPWPMVRKCAGLERDFGAKAGGFPSQFPNKPKTGVPSKSLTQATCGWGVPFFALANQNDTKPKRHQPFFCLFWVAPLHKATPTCEMDPAFHSPHPAKLRLRFAPPKIDLAPQHWRTCPAQIPEDRVKHVAKKRTGVQ